MLYLKDSQRVVQKIFLRSKFYNFILKKKYLYNKGGIINEKSFISYEYHGI